MLKTHYILAWNRWRFVQLCLRDTSRCTPEQETYKRHAYSASEMDRKPHMKFNEILRYMFYVTKFFGLIPYSLSSYRRQKIFESSFLGNLQSILFLIAYIVSYHFSVAQIYFDGQKFDSGKEINEISLQKLRK